MNYLLVASLAAWAPPPGGGAPAGVGDGAPEDVGPAAAPAHGVVLPEAVRTHVVPDGVELVAAADVGVDAIGLAYWESYGGEAAESTLAEAVEDVRRAFFGAYGPFRPDASLAARVDGVVVGAVLTVDDAPWDGVPPGPYVIDLFVVDAQRRRGIGRALMTGAMAGAAAGGATSMGLRVENDAVAARALYDSLGFHPI